MFNVVVEILINKMMEQNKKYNYYKQRDSMIITSQYENGKIRQRKKII